MVSTVDFCYVLLQLLTHFSFHVSISVLFHKDLLFSFSVISFQQIIVVEKMLSSSSIINTVEGGSETGWGVWEPVCLHVLPCVTLPRIHDPLVEFSLASTMEALFMKPIRLIAMGIPRLSRCTGDNCISFTKIKKTEVLFLRKS